VCLDGQTGFLIPPRDLAALAERIARLADDPSLRRRLGSKGRDFVRERFPVQRMVDDLHALYLRLAAERGIADAGGASC